MDLLQLAGEILLVLLHCITNYYLGQIYKSEENYIVVEIAGNLGPYIDMCTNNH